MKKVVIFDMDGTLIDSAHDITVSVNHVRATEYGLAAVDAAYVVDAINRYHRNLAYLFYGTQEYEPRAKTAFEEHYFHQCVQNVSLYEGVFPLLQELTASGFLLSVATNAPVTFARRMLERLDIDSMFGHIVGADMVHTPKPDKAMLMHILDAYGFSHGNDIAWMVGDNLKDIEAARNAQIRSIFAAWGFSRDGEGDHIAHAPGHVRKIVASVPI